MKRVFFLFLIICLLFSTSVSALDLVVKDEKGKNYIIHDFLDTQGHWAHDTILKVAEYNLIQGYNGNFMPNQPIKRGDLAIIIDRMLGLKGYSYNYYNDLSNNDYYADSLLRCVAAGYITGISDTEINPDGYATREQVAVILSRIFDLVESYSGSTNFKDDSQISSWAKNSVSAMSRLGYINGDDRGYMNPQANITRAEFVTLLNNFAHTYMPLNASQIISAEYTNDFPINVVASKKITLRNSTIGRDLILTHSAVSANLYNTTVRGRLLAIGKQQINLSDCNISNIVLLDSVCDIYGITEGVECITVKEGASESILNGIPKTLVLEPGVRVKVSGKMYENTSTRTKTYSLVDLQGAISDEQGFILGGAKISGARFAQDVDNTITVTNIKITPGDSDIKEIGVIWLEQDEDENDENPTYKKNDGKKVYRSDKIDELISFEVGEVEGTCAYRVYVKDKDGLLAYSTSTIFSEYEFTTELNIYDNDYPKKVDVELIFKGENVPNLANVRVVYDVDETYSESHNAIALSLYTNSDAEYQPDPKKYKRYTATIQSMSKLENGELEYLPPTAFGYIIRFQNGTLINRFPVLTNVVPEGVSPMSTLETGSAVYNGSNNLTIKNNLIKTRYIIPQEVGVAYMVSNSESVRNPSGNSSGWTKKSAYSSLGLNESNTFNVSIPLIDTEGYTYYAVYVKTSNGYWYGDVKKFDNNVKGDEGGYSILGASAECLGDSEVLVKLDMDYSKGMPTSNDFIELSGFGTYKLSDLQSNIYGNKLYFVLDNMNPLGDYNIPIIVKNIYGLKSNSVDVSFNISKSEIFSLTNKNINGNRAYYTISPKNNADKYIYLSASSRYDDLMPSIQNSNLSVINSDSLDTREVVLKYTYYAEGTGNSGLSWVFTKTIPLY